MEVEVEVEVNNSWAKIPSVWNICLYPLILIHSSVIFEVDIPWTLHDCGVNLDWILSVQAGRTELSHTSNKEKPVSHDDLEA